MKPKGYIFFHLNLAFSSIEEEKWPSVIEKCYFPLLDLAEKQNIPIGVELTGWTLEQINRIKPAWVTKFKKLLKTGRCELIGSGYSQVIAPLVPNSVNEWNQKLGIEMYKKILNCKPRIALVNEMAFSNSLVDLYTKFKYEALIMDRDNIQVALKSKKTQSTIPSYAEGINGNHIQVLWSDSILFQKVQHYAHGDICLDDYEDYLKSRIAKNSDNHSISIYSNDAEIFDFRPGRFKEEAPTHTEGEWNRLSKLINSIKKKIEIDLVLPSQALQKDKNYNSAFKLEDASYPIPVKKQTKYNIARWAVTGKNDIWLNTMCHRIEECMQLSRNNNKDDWKVLCELWASDLRTHITQKRWKKALDKLNKVIKKNKISNTFYENYHVSEITHPLSYINTKFDDIKIGLEKDDTLLSIATSNINLKLNLRRGMAIQSLAFKSHGMESCIGTLPHGHFSCISLGADFYSGGVIAELPILRKRITDLERVEPSFVINKKNEIEVHCEVTTEIGKISKVITVSTNNESISLDYYFSNIKIIGSVRLGILTLVNSFNYDTEVQCANGGNRLESFKIDEEFDHSKPASSLVSSTSWIEKITLVSFSLFELRFCSNGMAALLDLLQFKKISLFKFLRRISPVVAPRPLDDDTLKESIKTAPFQLQISSKKIEF